MLLHYTLYIRPNQVRDIPGLGGWGDWAGAAASRRVRSLMVQCTQRVAGRCGHRPLRTRLQTCRRGDYQSPARLRVQGTPSTALPPDLP